MPFYLKLMGLNATWVGGEVWDDLVQVGRTAELDDVVWLLRVGAWRPVVMGAWFSLRFDLGQVGTDVLAALSASEGSLTAPPLAAAAVALTGLSAAPALRGSRARTDGASYVVLDAALESLGEEPRREVTPRDLVAFAQLLAFARRLRDALIAA
ncbi:hypothetical protein [Actinopolymorpha sp. B17G11]|uniref:hypothetical protein n=1 Tax=Actinopolymorpha sp. B17G11 TaxID=3160861 RepID=UPI0032E401E6